VDIQIPGIHHVTAVTGDASGNVDFYTRTLGLRLVKKTVNQDDVSAYHLFYGDRLGSPGTEMTFFDWPDSPPARPGLATIAPVAFRVPGRAALEWWAGRLASLGVAHGGIEEAEGRLRLPFSDPEGQRLELVDDARPSGGTAWEQSPVPPEHAIRGFHDVTVTSARPATTEALLTRVLGFREAGRDQLRDGSGSVGVFEAAGGGPGAQLRVVTAPDAGIGRVGIGGVHHVAFRTPDEEQQLEWRERLARAGLAVTPVIDRFYFHSIYFREPGGALFEIATDGPGFATDEPEEALGRRLSLPPFLEPERERIQAALRPIEARAET
jgi:glyoxalase family protein